MLASAAVSVDIREIREVRKGKCSRDFERNVDEAKRCDENACFVILYGMEFRLKTLSLVGTSAGLVYSIAVLPVQPDQCELSLSPGVLFVIAQLLERTSEIRGTKA